LQNDWAYHHGLVRSSNVGREEMLELCIAVEEYFSQDHKNFEEKLEQYVEKIVTNGVVIGYVLIPESEDKGMIKIIQV
jgi:hypothetical protein